MKLGVESGWSLPTAPHIKSPFGEGSVDVCKYFVPVIIFQCHASQREEGSQDSKLLVVAFSFSSIECYTTSQVYEDGYKGYILGSYILNNPKSDSGNTRGRDMQHKYL